MGNLKRNYNRFIFKHRNKGIPNLMTWICLGNAAVFLLWRFFNIPLPGLLNFDSNAIMQGQVWRLFTYIFTFASEGSFFGSYVLGALFSILFYHWIGKMLEMVWGTLRFNLYYLCGILLTDLVGMAIHWGFGLPVSLNSTYLNLSLFLAVATLVPDNRILLMMFIPIKMKWMAWVDFIITANALITGIMECIFYWNAYGSYLGLFHLCIGLLPLVAILNYFLFFGRGIANVMPDWLKRRMTAPKKNYRTTAQTPPRPDPNWANNYRSSNGERPYRHKCTVCGRTDTNCPGLEFRYCSKCKGYFCYCIDHINNHNHVQ